MLRAVLASSRLRLEPAQTTPIESSTRNTTPDPSADVAAGVTDADRALYPTLVSALVPATSHFRAVAQARIYSHARTGDDAESRARRESMARFYPALVRAFEERYGMAEYHWCEHATAAAVFTSRKTRWAHEEHLWLMLNLTGANSIEEKALRDCVVLKDEIEAILVGSSRRRCLAMLFAVVTTALARLDDRVRDALLAPAHRPLKERIGRVIRPFVQGRGLAFGVDTESAQGYLEARLAAVRTQFAVAAQRVVQQRYLVGMTAGALVIGALVAGLLLVTPTRVRSAGVEVTEYRRLLLCLLAGTAGAVVSVLVRMTRERGVEVDASAGRFLAAILGTIRPLLGATSGLVIFLLLGSGALPLSSDDTSQLTQLYAVLAFGCGFSEQLVPDALGLPKQPHGGD